MSGAVESTGVTSMVNEACEQVDVLGKFRVPIGNLVEQAELQDLKEYYRRPRIVKQGAITSSATRPVFDKFDFPSAFSSAGVLDLSRLTGVSNIRFDLVFTLQVANTPFQQGIMCMAWNYGMGTADGGARFMRTDQVYSCTNVPHVRLDMSQSTMVQLHVPFLWNRDFISLEGFTSAIYGNLSLSHLLPCTYVSGVSAPSYKLLYHFENLELIGAKPYTVRTVTAQSGRELPFNAEQESEAYPLSSGLHAGSKALKLVSRGIPALSSVASTASWLLKGAAGAARSFGYSKPQIQDPINRVAHFDTIYEHNVDTPSGTVVVGPLANNSLKPSAFAGTDVDEMALEYVLTQWSQVCFGALASTAVHGDVLYGARASPSVFWYREPTGMPYGNIPPPATGTTGKNKFMPSSLFFWSSMFRQWRGDMQLRFTFGKTKMHGGRLLITWVPEEADVSYSAGKTVTAPGLVGTYADTTGFSAIWDLRDQSVFTFNLPYVVDEPNLDFLSSSGSVTVTVLDPLEYSPTVPSTVHFLVEARAAPGFEVSVPIGPLYMPIDSGGVIRLQSGRVVAPYKDDITQHTIGEKLMSVKQLIMIPKVTATTVVPDSSAFSVMPWWYQPKVAYNTETSAITAIKNTVSQAFTWGGVSATCYLYARGGTDAHVYPHGSFYQTIIDASFDQHACSDYSNPGSNPDQRSSTSQPRFFSVGTPLHARFPAYGSRARYLTHNLVAFKRDGTGTGMNWKPVSNAEDDRLVRVEESYGLYNLPKFHFWVDDSANVRIRFTRSAADDAQLGHYMGPTTLWVPASSSVLATSWWDPDNEYTS